MNACQGHDVSHIFQEISVTLKLVHLTKFKVKKTSYFNKTAQSNLKEVFSQNVDPFQSLKNRFTELGKCYNIIT